MTDTPPGPFQAVVLDCDGVLIDSEGIANQVLAETLADEIGLRITADESHRRFTGLVFSQVAELLHAETGRRLADGWVDRHFELLFARYRRDLRAVDGTLALIDRLDRAGIPWGVASQSPLHYLDLVLGIIGLGDRARGRIASSQEVARPKPAPDVYWLACARLGCDPGRTAVIEDSPTGVRAGVAAGATVFGHAADRPAAELHAAGARFVASRMDDLSERLLRGA